MINVIYALIIAFLIVGIFSLLILGGSIILEHKQYKEYQKKIMGNERQQEVTKEIRGFRK